LIKSTSAEELSPIAFSAILGLIRGFIREAFSFAGFAVAMYLAYHFSGVIATKWLTTVPGGITGQHALAFIGIFVSILIFESNNEEIPKNRIILTYN
jgi:uncharacterized membrane protein required for colicin V production